MGRSSADLEVFLGSVKRWFSAEMGFPYKHEHIKDHLEEMKKLRISKFIARRVGHLPDEDLVKFMAICEVDAMPPPIIAGKQEVIRGKPNRR